MKKRNIDILKAFKREINLQTRVVKSKKIYDRKKMKYRVKNIKI